MYELIRVSRSLLLIVSIVAAEFLGWSCGGWWGETFGWCSGIEGRRGMNLVDDF